MLIQQCPPPLSLGSSESQGPLGWPQVAWAFGTPGFGPWGSADAVSLCTSQWLCWALEGADGSIFFKFSIGAHHQQLSLNKKALLDCTLCLAAFLEVHIKGKLLQRKTSQRKNCQNPILRPACKLSSSYCCLHLTHLLLSTAALPGQRVQELRVPHCWESCPRCQGRKLWAETCLLWNWKG